MVRKIERFGKLLSEGIVSVARRQGKKIREVEQDLATQMSFTYHAVEHWRKGFPPREPEQIAFLARYCLRYGRVDRAWLNGFLVQADYPIHEREVLLAEVFPPQTGAEKARRLYQNLPPRYGELLGREKDMARVMEGLHSRWPLITIEGMAGVGKTTLTLEVGLRCLSDAEIAPDQRFQAVVWVSAKDRPEQQKWLEEVLDTIARVLDCIYVTLWEPTQKIEEVNKLLKTHRVLVIVDNYEVIKDPHLEQWLFRLPEPSKGLLTTRHGQMRSVWAIHLTGLEEPEALTLIRRHIRRLGLHDLERAKDAVFLPLVHVTEGNPKAIEMALGYIKRGILGLNEVIDNLHEARQTVNDVFDYLFTDAWELLNLNARHLLMTASFFVEPVEKETLGHVAGLHGYVLDTALGQLNDLSLLSANVASLRFGIHPLARAFVVSQMKTFQEWEQAGRERWLEWGRKLVGQGVNPTNYDDLKHEIANLIEVLDWLLLQSRLPDMAWFFQHIQRLLFAEGYWAPFLRIADEMLRWADTAGDRSLFRSSLPNFINIARHRNTRDVGQKWLELAQAFVDRTGDELLQAVVWQAQGRLWYEKGVGRIDDVNKALGIFQRYDEVERTIETLNLLGNIQLRLKKFEVAVQYYREGLELLQERRGILSAFAQIEWRAIFNGNLGIVLGRQGNYIEACRIIYETVPHLVDKSDVAEVYVLLAYYEFQQGHEEKAYQLRTQADQLIGSLGITPTWEEDEAWHSLRRGAW